MDIVSAFRHLRRRNEGDLKPTAHRRFALLSAGIAAFCLTSTSAGTTALAGPKDRALLATATEVPGLQNEGAPQAPLGFRMEGAPQLETVFGDVATYKARIDRFSALHGDMESERRRFAAAAHRLQTLLGPVPKVGVHKRGSNNAKRPTGCPMEAIASSVADANLAHARFKTLGIEYEESFRSIRDLHELGESAGLTPDYRSRVLRSRDGYRQALSDLAEMNAVMQRQLMPTLSKLGCKAEALGAHAASQRPRVQSEKPTPRANSRSPEKPRIRARGVTFFVDNRACGSGLDVYVDATLLGHVGAGTHAAFQSLSGRHSLCLLTEDSLATCGDTGTIRTAFVHDGFRIQRSCGE